MNLRHTGKSLSSINIKLLVLASHSTSRQHNIMPHAGRNESSLVGALVFCPQPKALQVHFHTACAGSLLLSWRRWRSFGGSLDAAHSYWGSLNETLSQQQEYVGAKMARVGV